MLYLSLLWVSAWPLVVAEKLSETPSAAPVTVSPVVGVWVCLVYNYFLTVACLECIGCGLCAEGLSQL